MPLPTRSVVDAAPRIPSLYSTARGGVVVVPENPSMILTRRKINIATDPEPRRRELGGDSIVIILQVLLARLQFFQFHNAAFSVLNFSLLWGVEGGGGSAKNKCFSHFS